MVGMSVKTAEASSSLELLHEKVRELVRQKGWGKLTEIQEKAIKPIMEGHNVVIVAPTGYGKTEAALLPVLSMMLKEDIEPVTVLYITPLRALINDIYERINWWASQLGFIVARKHGDVPHSERARRLRKAPHILVTTPESLEIDLDWASKFRNFYRNLRWVIVDEVHEIISTKRGVQLAVLLERFRRLAGDFQLIMISATIGEPGLTGKTFVGSSKRPLSIITVEKGKELEIVVDYVDAPSTEFWKRAAQKLLNHMEPLTLVFVNSKHVAERLHSEIEKMGIDGVVVHHASVFGEERRRIEKMAKEGKLKMIIATKTLELGIDIGSVKRVILFRPAGKAASLVQRLGRSGHSIGGKINGIIIATDELELLEAIAEARLAIKGRVEVPELLVKPLDMAARAIIGMALSGMYTVDDAYEILRNVYYFRGLSREEFVQLVKYLVENKMIKINEDGKMSSGAQFYRIWRFDAGDSRFSWWVHNFSEFFTTMGEKKTYVVKTVDGKIIGELDSDYVIRMLRIGHVIRLAGRNWQVINIDEHVNKVVVTESQGETTAVPFWKGQGPIASRLVLSELEQIIHEVHRGSLDLPEGLILSEDARKALSGLIEEIKKYRYPAPSRDSIIVERTPDELVFVTLAPEKVLRTLAYLVMLEAYRNSSDVYTRISHYGFSFPVNALDFDPIEFLTSMDREEFVKRVWEAASRSPFFVEVAHNIQLVFGITRKLRKSDTLVYEEVIRQTLQEYFDPESAWALLEGLRKGRVKLKINHGRTSIYARIVAKEIPERPWISDVDELIAETLKGMAFTAEELVEALGLPLNLIEAKLRDMRKPSSQYRVFSFIDVDTGEQRWALVEDAAEIVRSEEFSSSFEPPVKDSLYMLLVKNETGSLIHAIVRLGDVIEKPDQVIRQIPFNEIYELKVVPLTGYYEGQPPKYQYVPRDIVPYLVLNAATLIQKIQMNNPIF